MWPLRPRAFNFIKLIVFTEFLFGLFIAISLCPLAALDLRNAPDAPSNLQYTISVRAHRRASPAAAPAAPLLTIEHTHVLAVARSTRCSTHASHPLSLLILSPPGFPRNSSYSSRWRVSNAQQCRVDSFGPYGAGRLRVILFRCCWWHVCHFCAQGRSMLAMASSFNR
jgi:hypothetical protein